MHSERHIARKGLKKASERASERIFANGFNTPAPLFSRSSVFLAHYLCASALRSRVSENQPRAHSMHIKSPAARRAGSDCSQTKTLHQSALAIAWVRRSLSITRESRGDCYFQVTPLFSRFCRLILGCTQHLF